MSETKDAGTKDDSGMKWFLQQLIRPFAWLFGEHGYEYWLGVALLVGVAVVVLYLWHSPFETKGVALLLAGAASAVGVLTGFLFGIPRTRQREALRQGATPAAQPVAAGDSTVNTNLEDISDWLTKIIVGVGLVQLTSMPEYLMSMAEYLATAFGTPQPIPPAAVNLIMAYFAIFAFLLGYLWTRLFLAGEFSKAEREARERPEYFEGIIHALLYQPKPYGFTEAIERGETYKKRFGESNDRVWAYLACAYGQQYSYLKASGNVEQDQVLKAKKNALDAARQASRSPEVKHMLFRQWNKSPAEPGEDDLSDLYEDPGFQELFKDLKTAAGTANS